MTGSLKLGGIDPATAPKIRRLNRVPIIVAIALVVIFLAVVFYGLTSRGLRFVDKADGGSIGSQSASSYADQLTRGVPDGIIGEPAQTQFQPRPVETADTTTNPFTPKTEQTTPAAQPGSAQLDYILNLAREVQALGRVMAHPDLQGDPVARREVTARLAGAQGMFEAEVARAFGVVTWYHGRDATSKWFESASWVSFAAINDPETADYISRRCGNTTVEVDQLSRSSAMSGSSRTRSRPLSARPLILPEEVLRMRGDEQIVFTAGNAPLRCGRAIWFRRRDMRSIVSANRFHARGKT
jgi:hypothetical protein